MAFSPGARLGPYEILSALGAGGMGEVYRARDTKLGRTVAVKVLPDAVASHPDRIARFAREAKALARPQPSPHRRPLRNGRGRGAALPRDGTGGGRDACCASRTRAVPTAAALTPAIQIVEALAAAHRAGIVHRDLKPANVMMTKAGVKLIDFGLAKASEPAAAGRGCFNAPDDPARLDEPGTILGTFQYMAPEQIEGQ